jgi:hypothetical protein
MCNEQLERLAASPISMRGSCEVSVNETLAKWAKLPSNLTHEKI